MPVTAAAALPFIAAGTDLAGTIMQGRNPRRQFKYNKKLATYQNKLNRRNQEWALEQNRRLLEEQRVYDSPAEQMARYKAGGLNPHLIYGGAGGGSSPIQVGAPNTNVGGVDASYPTGNPAGAFIESSQALAQTGLTEAKTLESAVKSELMGIQRAIAATNPMLDPSVYQRTIDVLMSTGELKLKEQSYLMQSTMKGNNVGEGNPRYQQKINAEVEAMAQRLGLNTEDLNIKNQILKSKEYENALKDIQLKWMQDGEVTPQHIFQGLMLLLTKFM